MSLRVWLPLTRDLSNQGLSDISVTNNGATLSDGGKLGKCYSFSGSAQYLQFDKTLDIYSGDFSYAVWLKPTDSTRGVIFSEYASTGASNVGYELTASRGIRIYWNGSPDIYPTNCTLPLSEWTHTAIVKTTNKIEFYVNGELRYTYTGILSERHSTSKIRIGDDYRGGTSVSYMGYMNDVRIYDNALSVKEVKELSKGLVCHYKLDDRSVQQMDNYYVYPTFDTSNANGGWSHWGSTGHAGTFGQNTDKQYIFRQGQTYSHWVANGESATQNYLVYQSPAFEGGYRSLCCILKEENSSPISESIIYPAWNADDASSGVVLHEWTSIQYLHNGFYLCKVEGFKQTGSNDLVGLYIKPGYKVYVSECYLENDKQCCSDIFSLYNGIVYDSSGYNNHSILNASTSVSSSTPRGSLSTLFGAQNTPKSTLINTSLLSSLTNCTVCWWEKPITTDNMLIFSNASASSRYIGAGSTSRNLYDSDIGTSGISLYRDGVLCTTSISGVNVTHAGTKHVQNEWHHFALTGINLSSWTNFYINTYDGYPTQSYLSDVRIYATPLSASDIVELCNVGQSISNKKELFAYELNETDTNELMAITFTDSYARHNPYTNPHKTYNANGEAILNGSLTSIGSEYIPISPSNNKYYYDMMLSVNAGNQFYVGFERYDKDKTPRSNNACIYVYANRPTSDVVKLRYRGIVDLSTDGVNPCAFIALRILNGWTGTTSGVVGSATIHYLSLRQVDNSVGFNTSFGKNGVVDTNLLLEPNGTGNIEKTGTINMTNFIEI